MFERTLMKSALRICNFKIKFNGAVQMPAWFDIAFDHSFRPFDARNDRRHVGKMVATPKQADGQHLGGSSSGVLKVLEPHPHSHSTLGGCLHLRVYPEKIGEIVVSQF